MNRTQLSHTHILKLQDQLEGDLPGAEYQNLLSAVSNPEAYQIVPDEHKIACVMALLHEKRDGLFITYIKRASSHPDDKHAGQIGFPGGKLEEEDASFIAGAVRETEEEIGIPSSDIHVIGKLSPLYVSPSNFLVHPFVGFTEKTPSYIPQISEVADIIEVPLYHLFDPMTKVARNIKMRQGILKNAPGYDINGDHLWGATAMITSELEEVVKRSGII